MTAETIKAALEAVEKGEVIELSHDVAMGAPHISPIQTPYVMTMSRTAKNMEKFLSQNMGATNDIGFYLERIEMTTHVSTFFHRFERGFDGFSRHQVARAKGIFFPPGPVVASQIDGEGGTAPET